MTSDLCTARIFMNIRVIGFYRLVISNDPLTGAFQDQTRQGGNSIAPVAPESDPHQKSPTSVSA
jgi:hypothetical protein